MNRKIIALLTALGLVAGVGIAVSGGAANAYPPGTALAVAATPQPVKPKGTLTVTATNVKPGCYVTFVIDGKWRTVRANGTSVTSTISAPAKPRTYTLRAKTTSCKGYPEVAYTQVTVKAGNSDDHHTNCKIKAKADGKKVEVWLSGYKPGTTVVVKVSRNGTTYSATTKTSSKGNAEVDIWVKDKGSYLVTATSDGKVLTTSVTVK